MSIVAVLLEPSPQIAATRGRRAQCSSVRHPKSRCTHTQDVRLTRARHRPSPHPPSPAEGLAPPCRVTLPYTLKNAHQTHRSHVRSRSIWHRAVDVHPLFCRWFSHVPIALSTGLIRARVVLLVGFYACPLTLEAPCPTISPSGGGVVVEVAAHAAYTGLFFTVLISGEGYTTRLGWAHDEDSMADDGRGALQTSAFEAHSTMKRGPP